MAIDITKGIEPFNDHTDFSRNNADRKPFGKSGTDQLNMGDEYAVVVPAMEAPKAPETVTPPAAKFTHKLANGTALEAPTIEELASLIEKSFQTQPPAPLEFEDKPVYEPVEFKRKELSLTEQANILNVWKENPQKAMRMLQEAEYGAPMEVVHQSLERAELRELNRKQEEAGAEFLAECETYNPTPANGKKLTAFLREKNKPITKQNLVLSFQQLVATGDKSLLRKVDAPVLPEVTAADDPSLTEVPPPPTVVPSNQGRPEAPAAGQVDVAKFASLPLDQQKKFFADLRRRQ